MNTGNWLAGATEKLKIVGIGTARLDSLVILEDVTKIDRARLLAEPETELSPVIISKLTNLLNRRATHEPLSYVRGHTEFYGRNFVITPDVLEPRPESETMIELLIKLNKANDSRLDWNEVQLADVGSGSGALGITAKLELPNIVVELIDIDENALKVSKMNVDLFTISVSELKSDLLEQTTKNYDVLLCNLPYVPDDHDINFSALHEPKIAIFGGPDGLDVYRKLFDQITRRAFKPLYILTESLPTQHNTLKQLGEACGYDLTDSDGFILVFTLADIA